MGMVPPRSGKLPSSFFLSHASRLGVTQPGLHRWRVAMGLTLCAACATAPSRPVPHPAPVETPGPADGPETDAPDTVWMDCRADADCAARQVGSVCHRDVMGGTCAPPCVEDSVCTGLDADYHCVAQRCAKP